MDNLQQSIDMSKATSIICEKCGHVNEEFLKLAQHQ